MIQFLMQDAAKQGGLCFWPVKFWRGRPASAMHSDGDTWVTVQSLHCRMLLVQQPVAAQIYVCGTRSSIKDHEFRCSGFWPFIITTNTTASSCHITGSECGIPGGGGFQTPTPPKFGRPSKIVPNLTRLWKLLKIAEFRMPTPQDVQKKGSKIL